MYKRVLVLVDAEIASMQAVRQGVEVARVNGGEVLFFHLLPNFNLLPVAMHDGVAPRPLEYEQTVRREASAALQRASSIAEAAGVLSFRSMGSPESRTEAQCVADVAEKRRCDLIVIGTDVRNALVRLIGRSIVPGLISCAKVPVLVCQSKDSADRRMGRTKLRTQKRRLRPSKGDARTDQASPR